MANPGTLGGVETDFDFGLSTTGGTVDGDVTISGTLSTKTLLATDLSLSGDLTVAGTSTLAVTTATTPVTTDNSTNVATTAFVKAQDYGHVDWIPYTASGQSFNAYDLTRDGSWTMVANKATTDRPAPQPTGPEADLLPAWTPATQNARASYTVYNEWTLASAGWLNQYGADIITQNVGMSHSIQLRVNGVVQDSFSAIPNSSGLYFHDITPILVVAGAVIRVTLTVTQPSSGNPAVYWLQQTGLFATAPPNTSLAQGSKDGAAAGTTAYGCHLMFIPGAVSPDWDVVAYGGAAGGGGATVPPTFTVATLPAAASNQGMHANVSDATATTFYSVVAAGGTSYVPVFSDGTDWRIG